MALITVETTQGDTLDSVAFRRYGRVDSEILTEVIDVNQNILDHSVAGVFPEGVEVKLPEVVDDERAAGVIKLWD